jgi:16S rRNA processing protein RimM
LVASERSDRLEIGRIGAPHGLRGDVHASLHFAGSEALSRAKRVTLRSDSGTRELALRLVRPHGRGIVLGFEGIEDRDAAATLRGSWLEIERRLLSPLAPGEYYLVDLIGASVVGPEGPVGEVVGIASHPSIACLELKLTDGRLAEQPLADQWVARVDVDAGRVELASLDGLVV